MFTMLVGIAAGFCFLFDIGRVYVFCVLLKIWDILFEMCAFMHMHHCRLGRIHGSVYLSTYISLKPDYERAVWWCHRYNAYIACVQCTFRKDAKSEKEDGCFFFLLVGPVGHRSEGE